MSGLSFGCAFIKGVNGKQKRRTFAQSESKPPERVEKECLVKRLVGV
jgi:hypothetical protein